MLPPELSLLTIAELPAIIQLQLGMTLRPGRILSPLAEDFLSDHPGFNQEDLMDNLEEDLGRILIGIKERNYHHSLAELESWTLEWLNYQKIFYKEPPEDLDFPESPFLESDYQAIRGPDQVVESLSDPNFEIRSEMDSSGLFLYTEYRDERHGPVYKVLRKSAVRIGQYSHGRKDGLWTFDNIYDQSKVRQLWSHGTLLEVEERDSHKMIDPKYHQLATQIINYGSLMYEAESQPEYRPQIIGKYIVSKVDEELTRPFIYDSQVQSQEFEYQDSP